MDFFSHMQRMRYLWDNHNLVGVSSHYKVIGYSGLSSEKGTDLRIQPIIVFCKNAVQGNKKGLE